MQLPHHSLIRASHTFIVAVARLPRIRLLDSEKVLMLIGPCCWARSAAAVGSAARDSWRLDAPDVVVLTVVAASDKSRDDTPDTAVPLDVAAKEEELAASEEVVAVFWATGAALVEELVAVLDATPLDAGLDVAVLNTELDTAADEAIVCRVVGANMGATATALVGNELSPQRHEQAQDPSGLRFPLPLTIAPGEATAGAAAASKSSVYINDSKCEG